jgi:hypothetical protein
VYFHYFFTVFGQIFLYVYLTKKQRNLGIFSCDELLGYQAKIQSHLNQEYFLQCTVLNVQKIFDIVNNFLTMQERNLSIKIILKKILTGSFVLSEQLLLPYKVNFELRTPGQS